MVACTSHTNKVRSQSRQGFINDAVGSSSVRRTIGARVVCTGVCANSMLGRKSAIACDRPKVLYAYHMHRARSTGPFRLTALDLSRRLGTASGWWTPVKGERLKVCMFAEQSRHIKGTQRQRQAERTSIDGSFHRQRLARSLREHSPRRTCISGVNLSTCYRRAQLELFKTKKLNGTQTYVKYHPHRPYNTSKPASNEQKDLPGEAKRGRQRCVCTHKAYTQQPRRRFQVTP